MPVNKEALYELSLVQIKGLIESEPNLIANLSNVSAVLKENLNFFWIGFYLVDKEELVLGPFQGPVACTRIPFGKGVCGLAWKKKTLMNVPDVHEFPGHISCNDKSRSEIVLPVLDSSGKVFCVLDIDSIELADFEQTDEVFLSRLIEILKEKHG
jgi:GAF domain-containing protein